LPISGENMTEQNDKPLVDDVDDIDEEEIEDIVDDDDDDDDDEVEDKSGELKDAN
jgi:hypothetical protein